MFRAPAALLLSLTTLVISGCSGGQKLEPGPFPCVLGVSAVESVMRVGRIPEAKADTTSHVSETRGRDSDRTSCGYGYEKWGDFNNSIGVVFFDFPAANTLKRVTNPVPGLTDGAGIFYDAGGAEAVGVALKGRVTIFVRITKSPRPATYEEAAKLLKLAHQAYKGEPAFNR